MASSSNIWWQILAGNPHDCCWSRPPCAVVVTGLYPLGVQEAFATSGWLARADLLPAIVESVESSVVFTDAYTWDWTTFDTLEEVESSVVFTSVTTFTSLHAQPPDEVESSVVFTYAHVSDTMVRYTHPGTLETMTATGWVTSATLSA